MLGLSQGGLWPGRSDQGWLLLSRAQNAENQEQMLPEFTITGFFGITSVLGLLKDSYTDIPSIKKKRKTCFLESTLINSASSSIAKTLSESPGSFVHSILGSVSLLTPSFPSCLDPTPELFLPPLFLSVREQFP